ncbi:hypothetical protein FB45DRAFT_868728 [Roridomyces roridus]|uniref:Uncharacterized protein n=1 Tax=Roridomyces roridus TaxID=1738132 RepID=A0AAD7BMB4_9AGAR|nr:hypothetical protein FB45DRAFT_868728 [Roridomyces roridus]
MTRIFLKKGSTNRNLVALRDPRFVPAGPRNICNTLGINSVWTLPDVARFQMGQSPEKLISRHNGSMFAVRTYTQIAADSAEAPEAMLWQVRAGRRRLSRLWNPEQKLRPPDGDTAIRVGQSLARQSASHMSISARRRTRELDQIVDSSLSIFVAIVAQMAASLARGSNLGRQAAEIVGFPAQEILGHLRTRECPLGWRHDSWAPEKIHGESGSKRARRRTRAFVALARVRFHVRISFGHPSVTYRRASGLKINIRDSVRDKNAEDIPQTSAICALASNNASLISFGHEDLGARRVSRGVLEVNRLGFLFLDGRTAPLRPWTKTLSRKYGKVPMII